MTPAGLRFSKMIHKASVTSDLNLSCCYTNSSIYMGAPTFGVLGDQLQAYSFSLDIEGRGPHRYILLRLWTFGCADRHTSLGSEIPFLVWFRNAYHAAVFLLCLVPPPSSFQNLCTSMSLLYSADHQWQLK